MHATQVLDNHIYKMCQDIHKVRWNALMSTVSALIQGKKLSVTGLGRSMPGESYQKHQIKKRIDLSAIPTSITNASLSMRHWHTWSLAIVANP